MEAIQNKMALIPEGRKSQSLFLKFTVKENISIVFLKKVLNKVGLNIGSKEKKVARDFVAKLRIKTPGIDQKIINLSVHNSLHFCAIFSTTALRSSAPS